MFSQAMVHLIEDFHEQITETTDRRPLKVLKNTRKQAILQSMENGVHKMASPLQRLEHGLHGWVSFLIVPIFALANAGIPIDLATLPDILLHPVTIGIIFGLLFGKVAGVYLFSLVIVKLRLSDLPRGVTLPHIVGIGLLSGIGFTMSIFIGGLAFENQPEYLLNAKIGIVFASFAAGTLGYIWLHRLTSR
jgi:NhaA family Na+:H+ antiporter